jgi:UDP-N-acetylmuramate--alanine ligase
MENFLVGKQHIHFIGIGGSGMYPLAQILHGKGYNLSGSDNNDTATLEAVRNLGIPVHLGHAADNINGADLIVYSAAIAKTNPELTAAASLGVETRERAELLGLITSFYPNTIAVCGTHGKTTVTSMITQIFLAANVDLTAVIGGKLPALHGSGKSGASDIMTVEACEYNDTFLHLFPDVSVVLNIDEDHMEYFKTLGNLRASFSKFVNLTSKCVVYNADDFNTEIAVSESDNNAIDRVDFGWKDTADYYPANAKRDGVGYTFDVYKHGEHFLSVRLSVPGYHNILNAVAAVAAADYSGVSKTDIARGLTDFTGAGRRFEIKGVINGMTVADDYAHHPAEVKVTLQTAKTLGFKRVIAVHQPFTYTRTERLLSDFADVLQIADKVFITEIMGSREVNTTGIKATALAAKIPDSEVIPDFANMARRVTEYAEDGDLVITLGCGDVYKISDILVGK